MQLLGLHVTLDMRVKIILEKGPLNLFEGIKSYAEFWLGSHIA